MTETFRTGIHDTIRNLRPSVFGDARDMKTRDYARAIRKHRVDPCGGSLLHAHMSSLEFDTAARQGSSAPFAGGAVGSGSLRQSSSLGTFRSRFSPPSSPLSTRRALAGYGRGRSRGAGGGGGSGGVRDSYTIPADNRQTLLLRELSSVKLAAEAVAGDTGGLDGPICGDASFGSCDGITPISVRASATGATPMTGEGITASSMGGSRGRGVRRKKASAQYCAGVSTAERRTLDSATSDGAGVEWRHGGRMHNNSRVEFSPSGESGERESRGGSSGFGGNSAAVKGRVPKGSTWRENPRTRRRRRSRPTDAGLTAVEKLKVDNHTDGGQDGPLVPPDPNASSPNPRWRTTPTPATATRAKKTLSRRRHQPSSSPSPSSRPRSKPCHLKKPFSSDSLLSCLLDVRFGNTRDLSPIKPPGQKWDLRALPAGMAIGMSAPAGGCWDGFDESDDGLREGARDDVAHGEDDCDSSVARDDSSSSSQRQTSDRRVPNRSGGGGSDAHRLL